jgi:hypothetical protein
MCARPIARGDTVTAFHLVEQVEPRAAMNAFFTTLSTKQDVERLPWCWAVPHASHIGGSATAGSRLRERASVADGGTFIHLACSCGATPHEIAADLLIPADWLHPLAAEQTFMIQLQRRLREDRRDKDTLSMLRERELTVAQVLRWKPSDAGWPPEMWGARHGE